MRNPRANISSTRKDDQYGLVRRIKLIKVTNDKKNDFTSFSDRLPEDAVAIHSVGVRVYAPSVQCIGELSMCLQNDTGAFFRSFLYKGLNDNLNRQENFEMNVDTSDWKLITGVFYPDPVYNGSNFDFWIQIHYLVRKEGTDGVTS